MKGSEAASSKNDDGIVSSVNVSVLPDDKELSENKFLAPVAQGYVAYMSCSQLWASRSNTSSEIFLNAGVKSGDIPI